MSEDPTINESHSPKKQKGEQQEHNSQKTESTVEAQSAGSNDNAIAAVAYIIFFIPLLVEPKTEFKTFHANQGLLLLIFWVAGSIISSILATVLIGFFIGAFVGIFGFIFLIMGIVNALNGKQDRLPLIGKWDLLK